MTTAETTPVDVMDPDLISPVGLARRFIEGQLSAGSLPPGTALVEARIARQLGLSRGPVREAIIQMAAEGFISLRPRRSAVVPAVSSQDVFEVYAIRAAVGDVALEALSRSPDRWPELISTLRHLAAQALTAGKSNRQPALVKADLAFQDAIVAAAQLPRIQRIFRRTSAELAAFIRVLRITYPDVATICDEHKRLVAAFEQGDTRAASAVWHGRFARASKEFVGAMTTPSDCDQ